jgi:hypothetical protein
MSMGGTQLVGTHGTQAPAQRPDIPAFLFDPGDRRYRFVNFDSHATNFDTARIVNPIQHPCSKPGRARPMAISPTFAAPGRVAADRFGQARPQRLHEFRNSLPHNAFRCPCRVQGDTKRYGSEPGCAPRRKRPNSGARAGDFVPSRLRCLTQEKLDIRGY